MSQHFKPRFTPEAYHRFYSVFDAYNQKMIAIVKTLLDFEPKRVLDLACGTGISTAALRANFTDAAILAVDIEGDMIEFAIAANRDPKLEFRTAGIAETLGKTNDRTIDVIFIKSAYHYFDQEITLSNLSEVLSDCGAIVIAERTSRSARSYPLPDMAQSYWADFFSDRRVASRFSAAESANLRLSVSCYGEHVEVPIDEYKATVSAEELFGLSAMKTDLVRDWSTDELTEDAAMVTLFEEHWLYIYQLR